MKNIVEGILNKKKSSNTDLKISVLKDMLKDMFYGKEPEFNLDSIDIDGNILNLNCDLLGKPNEYNRYDIQPTNLNGIIDKFGIKNIEINNSNPNYAVKWELMDGSYNTCADLSKVNINYNGKQPLVLQGVDKIGKYKGNICFTYLSKNQSIHFDNGEPIDHNILLDLKNYKFPISAMLDRELERVKDVEEAITNIMTYTDGIPDNFMFNFDARVLDKIYDIYIIKGIKNPKEIDNYYAANTNNFHKLKSSDFKKSNNYDIYYWVAKIW